MKRSGIAIVCVGAVLLMAGCQTTRQTRSVEPSGFLGDYSMLKPGKGKEAQLVYINPATNWSQYDAVILDSVTVWHDKSTDKLSEESAQELTDYAYATIHEELAKSFRIVDHAAPGVMRIRVALTEAKGARVVGNAITSIVPQLRLLTTLTGAATDVQVFVGSAATEMDITDSLTSVRIAAAVDERSGTKAIRGGMLKWSDVKLAYEYWADRLRSRLIELGVRTTTPAS